MGGVELFDQFVPNDSLSTRSKKWCWPFFSWLQYDSAVTSRRLYRKLRENDVPLLKFIRELMLKIWGKSINSVSEHLGNSRKNYKT